MNSHTRIAVLLLLCAGFAGRAWPEVVVPIDSVASFVNVRLAPDAASEIVGRLQQGSQLRYVRTVDGWYEVELEGGGTGFVSVEWAKLLPDSEDHVAGVSGVAVQPPAEATDPNAPTDAVVEAETVADPAVEPLTEPQLDRELAAPAATAEEAPPGIDPALAEEPLAGAAPEAPVSDSPEPSAPPPEESPPLQPAVMKGAVDYLAKFSTPTRIGFSQVFDNGRNVGIGTSDPQQRLEVNGNIQIRERNSGVAGLMITQASGDTGYIMHNRGNTLTIGAGSVDRLTITADGNVGFGVNRPAHPIEMASGAHVSAGGVWTNSSSIDKKEN
ncbi:MAG: SH3 domain-containing protein, partial [Woeseiaceae bacterium]|nr:SH3 domain-containing protein [Woeseiaceae bacterium]